MVQVTDFNKRYIYYCIRSFLASFFLCAITETSCPALVAIFLGYADVFTTSKALCGKNSSKIKKIGVKVDSRIIWPMEDQDHRFLIKIVMTIMMMMMMMITITIQRGPTVFTMLGIFLTMQSLVKKTKAKKKNDRNEIKPAGTKKGEIFFKKVKVGKGFVVQLKINTCNRTDSCK